MMTNTIAAILLAVMSAPVAGQWLNYRDRAIPRTKDGKPNLSAPAPRTTDGRPDLSGVWHQRPGDDVLTYSKYFLNILADFKPEESPLRPEAAEKFERLKENRGKESPTANCLPPGLTQAEVGSLPHKIIQTPGLIVVMYEAFGGHRQIYMDGRKPPADPDPLWLGYSVGQVGR